MSDIDYVDDLPEGTFEWLDDADPPAYAVTPSVFERIGDYTRSQPTGPSPGRIYRKNRGWPGDMDDNWFVYVCVPDIEPGFTLHQGRRIIFMEE